MRRVVAVRVLALAKRVDHNRRDFRAAQMEGPRPVLLEEAIHCDERLTGGNAPIRERAMAGQARMEPPGYEKGLADWVPVTKASPVSLHGETGPPFGEERHDSAQDLSRPRGRLRPSRAAPPLPSQPLQQTANEP